MKIFFSSPHGIALVIGALVIILLALALIIIPAPNQSVQAPVRDDASRTTDALDQAIEAVGMAEVVMGPIYGTLDESGDEYGVLLFASEDSATSEIQYYLTLASAQHESGSSRGTYTFASGVIPQDLSLTASGFIVVAVDVDGSAEELRFEYRDQTLRQVEAL
jgi:hypothetical protein